MDKSKATVTIPYEEFEKHEKEVEEIKWAREFKKKVDSGQFVPKKTVDDLCRKLIIMGTFICRTEQSMYSTGIPPVGFNEFAKQNGYKTNRELGIDGNFSKDSFYYLEEIENDGR